MKGGLEVTGKQFFDAFGEIDGAYILAAGDVIYGGRGAHVRLRKSRAHGAYRRGDSGASDADGLCRGLAWAFGADDKRPRRAHRKQRRNGGSGSGAGHLYPVHHRGYISSAAFTARQSTRGGRMAGVQGSYADEKTAQQLRAARHITTGATLSAALRRMRRQGR